MNGGRHGDEAGSSAAPAVRLFISYRRDDSAGHAGRLYADLAARFGKDGIFIDVDAIKPGEDFVDVINRLLAESDIVIAVIGRSWLTSTDKQGRRRLDDPADFVRLELETALTTDRKLIPVLVHGAAMPSAEDLPLSLAMLTRKNAFELSDRRWQSEVAELVEAIERLGRDHARTRKASTGPDHAIPASSVPGNDNVAAPSGMVTLLFTDIEGSTRAWEANPDEMKGAVARHDEILRTGIEAAGGYVFKTVGDAFCAAFQDARAALEAAADIQRRLAAEPWPDVTPIRVRMALHAGNCEERDGDYFGPVVNRLARLEATAHGGQVVLSRLTADLVRDRLPEQLSLLDLGDHRLKDLGRPEQVFQACLAGLPAEFPPLRSLDNPLLRHNLPTQLSTFVGRTQEVAAIRALLHEARLVTLAGPGGVGKTRLALQVAAELLDRSGDGVWFVDLAPISDAATVAPSAAKVLGVRTQAGRPPVETLLDELRDRHLLIVLDNCEQVIDATATLADALLRTCPKVALMATSREPLRVDGEYVYRVPSLSVPRGDDDDPQSLAESEAVRLFVERARQQKSGFSLERDNAPTIARLCRRLDGIPFALELAAARLRSLSVRDLESNLDRRFRILTGGARTALPRQQTLQALIDWSYHLLPGAEQSVLVRLSVFAGGFDVAAAEAVCVGGEVDAFDVLDLLDALVDKSLVQLDDAAGGARYRLLETTRDYAAARLAERGDVEVTGTRRAHRDHFLALAEAAAPHLRGPDGIEWGDRLEVEHDNLRSALNESHSDPDPVPGLRLAVALTEFWFLRGYGVEGAEALRAQLGRGEAGVSNELRGRALVSAARLVENYLGDYPGAVALATEALEVARAANDDPTAAMAMFVLAKDRVRHADASGSLRIIEEALPVARRTHRPRPAADLLNLRGWALENLGRDGGPSLEEAGALFRSAEDRRGVLGVLGALGERSLLRGDIEAARGPTNEAVRLSRELRDPQALMETTFNAGEMAYLDGDDDTATGLFTECFELARRIGARRSMAFAILGLAMTATRTGEWQRAATLHGAFDGLHEGLLGKALEPLEAGLRDADHARLRTLLGDDTFIAAYQSGLAKSTEEVVVLATQSDGTQCRPSQAAPT